MNQTDPIIIAGGGAAGLSAAACAASRGAQVIVLEANPKTGGNGVFAEVLFGLGTREQARRGIRYDLDGYFQRSMDHSHWKNNARLVRRLLEASGENLDWLCDHGLEIAGLQDGDASLGYATHHTGGMHTGRDTMRVLRNFCENDPHIEIHTKTRVQRLLMEENTVVGVVAEQGGAEVTFRGRAVLIACGGFLGNPALISRIIPGVDPDAFAHIRGIRMHGDGILLAESAGGEILSDGCFENAGPTFAGTQALMGLVTKRYALWLNAQGRRFANEAIGDNFVYGCNAVYAQPGHFCYILLDNAMVQQAAAGPVDFLAGPAAVNSGMSGLQNAIQKEIAAGRVCVAPDLGGIAAWMGVSPAALSDEIRAYNDACRAGTDALFLKPAELLKPLEQGPYTCIRCGVDNILTHGGIRVDEKMRVLRADGSPIDGLYAAGADISGVDSNGYQVFMGGHSFGFSLTGGRLAAGSILAGPAGS